MYLFHWLLLFKPLRLGYSKLKIKKIGKNSEIRPFCNRVIGERGVHHALIVGIDHTHGRSAHRNPWGSHVQRRRTRERDEVNGRAKRAGERTGHREEQIDEVVSR